MAKQILEAKIIPFIKQSGWDFPIKRDAMSQKVTIDNLPPDAYQKYARNQEQLQSQEKTYTAPPTQVDALQPTYISEVEQLFSLQQTGLPWAILESPPGYVLRKDRVFSDRLLTRLGSEEKMDYLTTTLKGLQPPNAQAEAYAWQKEQKSKQFEQEKNRLLTLLGVLKKLDKVLIEINSKRRQYLKE